LVRHVAPDTPAKQAAVNLGDVIITAGSQAAQSVRQFYRLLMQKRIGETLELRLVRGGSTVETKITLGDRPRR
jgi:S1-C subfamily serine protease